MTHRALLVLTVCMLCGCATLGVPLSRCVGQQIIPNAKTSPCLASPEYYNARKKARQSIKEQTESSAKEADPRYKDWIP
jgi:hypothetical protein